MSDTAKQPATVILLREGFWQGIGSDLMSFGTLLAMVGVGIVLDSAAMQWIGGVMWLLWLFARTVGGKHRHVLQPQAAADFLAREYGVRAQP